MTFGKFESKWLGKRVDYDKVFGYQCVDLIKQYVDEVHSIRSGAWGNAIDYWRSPHPTLLTIFKKVAGTDALRGDIVIIKPISNNPYGHIGIATGQSDKTSVQILEENGGASTGTGLGSDAIRRRFVPRSSIAGLLRSKENEEMKIDKTLSILLWRNVKLIHSPTDKQVKSIIGKDPTDVLEDWQNDGDVVDIKLVVKQKYPEALEDIEALQKGFEPVNEQLFRKPK